MLMQNIEKAHLILVHLAMRCILNILPYFNNNMCIVCRWHKNIDAEYRKSAFNTCPSCDAPAGITKPVSKTWFEDGLRKMKITGSECVPYVYFISECVLFLRMCTLSAKNVLQKPKSWQKFVCVRNINWLGLEWVLNNDPL